MPVAAPPPAVPNAYPEIPALAYCQTSVAMTDVVAHLQGLAIDPQIKRATYIVFRNESANGRSGINDNFVGAQADGNRWPARLDPLFSGTVVKAENGTGRERVFLAFHSWRGSVEFLVDRVRERGLFIGGTTHLVLKMAIRTPEDLARAYLKEWVRGSAAAEPDADALAGFLSMFRQAQEFFA